MGHDSTSQIPGRWINSSFLSTSASPHTAAMSTVQTYRWSGRGEIDWDDPFGFLVMWGSVSLLLEKNKENRKRLGCLRPSYREGRGDWRRGEKMSVHLCGLWPDFGNDSRFCHISVDWQPFQENGMQQTKGILRLLRCDAQQSHRYSSSKQHGLKKRNKKVSQTKQPSPSPDQFSNETTKSLRVC